MADTHTNKGNQGQNLGSANKGGQSQHQNQGQGHNQGNANRGGQNQHQNQEQQGGMAGVAGVAQMARDAASTATKTVTDQAQHAAENIAGGIHSFAGSIREHAPEGMLGTAAGSVADTLDSGGRYLEQEGFSGMAEDIVACVRRYPIGAMLVCAGAGFLLGRMLTSNHNSGSY